MSKQIFLWWQGSKYYRSYCGSLSSASCILSSASCILSSAYVYDVFHSCSRDLTSIPFPLASRRLVECYSNHCHLITIESLDKLIRESKRQLRRQPKLTFLDIKAAYDPVSRGVLWRRCSALEYPSDIISSSCRR